MDTSPERPVPVRTIARHLISYVDRLGAVWIEGQVAQVTRRPGTRVFFTLRDTSAEMSLAMSCPPTVAAAAALQEGNRVVVHGKAEFYAGRGSLSFSVREIRAVGIGALLAQIESLRTTLAAEGLFRPGRKRPLPFLPATIGLITGRASDAERDVVENTRRRWPGVTFVIRAVAVQGPRAVADVIAALAELNTNSDAEVIVIARGGGSVEDLLPFSNEALLRAVADSRLPVVSAIGHEKDAPLLDLVADLRASTPTDAARHLVPDLVEQTRLVAAALQRVRDATSRIVANEDSWLQRVRSRPVFADRHAVVERRAAAVRELTARSRRAWDSTLRHAAADVAHTGARIRTLSPGATLDRGYAVVQRLDMSVVRTPNDASVGEPLRLRLAAGELRARVESAADD